MASKELSDLSTVVNELTEASIFNARDVAEVAAMRLLNLLGEMEAKIEELERKADDAA